MPKTFEQKVQEMQEKMRIQNILRSLDVVQGAIARGEVLKMDFVPTKDFDEDEPIVIDYSVDLADGSNIGDLNLESFEEAISEIAQELLKRVQHA